jgi:hypothetical protein
VASGERLDLRGRRLDDADFSGARLHGPNFEGTRITDGWLRNADISGVIDGLRVNGVDVAPLVQAELDRRFPQRVKLRATDPQGLAEAWGHDRGRVAGDHRPRPGVARAVAGRAGSTASGASPRRCAIWSWPPTAGCCG